MSTSEVTWLHLSDLHFEDDRKRGWNQKIVTDALIEDLHSLIASHHLVINFLFITGDISFKGQANGYKGAKEYINRIVSEVNIDKDNIFIIPGNHDVDRSIKSDLFKELKVKLINIGESNNKAYQDIIYDIFCEKKEIFQRSLYYKNEIADFYNLDFPFYIKNISSIDGLPVSIVGFNTSWLSFGDEVDRGQIFLGFYQAIEAIQRVQREGLKIALMHHPFDSWINYVDRLHIEDLLINNFDFILNGHIHQPKIEALSIPDGRAILLSSGAAYELSCYKHSYNIVNLNINSARESKIIFRKYNGIDHFIADTDRYKALKDNGIFEFIYSHNFHYFDNKDSEKMEAKAEINLESEDKNSNIPFRRYLDCLDSVRFSEKIPNQIIRNFYIKAQFILALISSDIIVISENQVFDSRGFIDTFNDILISCNGTKKIPVNLLYRYGENKFKNVFDLVSKKIAKNDFYLSLWRDLDGDIVSGRRQRWADAIKNREFPKSNDIISKFEETYLKKLFRILWYFDGCQEQKSSEDLINEFSFLFNKIRNIKQNDLYNLLYRRPSNNFERVTDNLFSSNDEVHAAINIINRINEIFNGIPINDRSQVINQLKKFPGIEEKRGIYELTDFIYNQVLGIATKANLQQTSTSRNQSDIYIRSGYLLAIYVLDNIGNKNKQKRDQEFSQYWKLLSFDIVRNQCNVRLPRIPWNLLLNLNSFDWFENSIREYKSILYRLQKFDQAYSADSLEGGIRESREDLINKLQSIWDEHTRLTDKYLKDSSWGISEDCIYIKRKGGQISQDYPRLEYNCLITKQQATRQRNWNIDWKTENLSIKGRFDEL